MWVLINKTYAGPLGMFFAGQKYDIPGPVADALRKKLGKGSVINTCAPWDEHKDHKAIAAAELKERALRVIKLAEECSASLRELDKQIKARADELDAARQRDEGARNEADDTVAKAKAKNATDKQKAEAVRAARRSDLRDAELMKAEALMNLAVAERLLKSLEAEDVIRETTELAKQAGIEWPPKDKKEDAGKPE